MNKKTILAVLAGSVVTIIIYLVSKTIAENNQKKDRLKAKRTPKFSDAYGEYTL